ncbi:hypothetical protein [Phenylobacterium deserti]|uniref:Cell envelope biogenesis protein TolA n=1 Tax=Phenylobacterium deserti TaxID=1914756 RepID=A0A328ADM2_9CAUL|nr:hypothetical protein [Phenylobacterium deserti]RAK52933.1 hypothetical protein DJ018_12210 [Phenylobacterium deserti]
MRETCIKIALSATVAAVTVTGAAQAQTGFGSKKPGGFGTFKPSGFGAPSPQPAHKAPGVSQAPGVQPRRTTTTEIKPIEPMTPLGPKADEEPFKPYKAYETPAPAKPKSRF